MSHELYFIPTIAGALGRPNPKAALYDAFQEIQKRGDDEGFRTGHDQFQRFVAHSIEHWRMTSPNAPDADSLRILEPSCAREVWLERDGERIAMLNADRIPSKGVFKGLEPGHFQLKADTGWTLWEATLSRDHLIWADVFPEQNLPLAAQSESPSFFHTLDVSLLSGTIHIRVFPGLEGGVMEIALEDQGQEP